MIHQLRPPSIHIRHLMPDNTGSQPLINAINSLTTHSDSQSSTTVLKDSGEAIKGAPPGKREGFSIPPEECFQSKPLERGEEHTHFRSILIGLLAQTHTTHESPQKMDRESPIVKQTTAGMHYSSSAPRRDKRGARHLPGTLPISSLSFFILLSFLYATRKKEDFFLHSLSESLAGINLKEWFQGRDRKKRFGVGLQML